MANGNTVKLSIAISSRVYISGIGNERRSKEDGMANCNIIKLISSGMDNRRFRESFIQSSSPSLGCAFRTLQMRAALRNRVGKCCIPVGVGCG
jgi:hypothetical protein